MFLLNHKTVEAVRGKLRSSDTDETILQKIYEAESVVAAQKDAEIKKNLESIDALKPESKEYQEELKQKAIDLVRSVPLQDRNVLSQYVARRKIVLELFGKILRRELERFENGKHIDENVLHNLIFQQHSEDPGSSDLWLINEELIYLACPSGHLRRGDMRGAGAFVPPADLQRPFPLFGASHGGEAAP